MKQARWLRAALLTCLLGQGQSAAAEDLLVAVASNFAPVMDELAGAFAAAEAAAGTAAPRISPVTGSTGKHYAQVRNGAPYHLLFAADSERPRLLEKEGRAVPGTRTTYAIGRLAVWSRNAELLGDHDFQDGSVLAGDYQRLAIANPRLAPYGEAAVQTLKNLGLLQNLRQRFVTGENIAQAFQFVGSGNAELGFVAWSQALSYGSGSEEGRGERAENAWWLVPAELHEPIIQQVVVLKATPDVRRFLEFVLGPDGRRIIAAQGYDLPPTFDNEPASPVPSAAPGPALPESRHCGKGSPC